MVQRSPRTGSVRTSVVSVRLQPEQRRAIEDAAITAGLTVSAYIAATMERAASQPDDAADAAVNKRSRDIGGLEAAVNKEASAATGPEPAVNIMPEDRDDAEGAFNLGKMLAGLSNSSVNNTIASASTSKTAVNSGVSVAILAGAPVNNTPYPIDLGKLANGLAPMPLTVRGPAVNKPFEADPRAFAIKFKPQPGGLPQAALDALAQRLGTAAPAASIDPADPAVLYELKRIGNNINQIAHAVNAGLPPDAKMAVTTFHQLFEALTDAEEYRRRLAALRTRKEFNGTAHP